MKRIFWLMLSGLLLAGGVLYVVMDHASCVDTEAVVLRNWHDYGWWHLLGGYVVNAGGIQAGEQARILHGHLTTSLWPHYIFSLLAGSQAASYWLAYLVFIGGLLGAFWWAFSDKKLALLWACAFVFSPALLRSYLDVDPVSYGLLYTIVLFPVGLKLLESSGTSRVRHVSAWLLLLFALSLDWPNALALVIWAPLFLTLHGGCWTWRRACLWLLPLGLFSALLMVAMILHKQQGITSLAFLVKHYSAGVDAQAGNLGVSWAVTIKRHVMASGLGWLPLWGVWSVIWLRGPRLDWQRQGLLLLPVVLSMCLLLAVKDYFAAHQWLVAPLVANGLTASLWGLSRQRSVLPPPITDERSSRMLAWTVPLMLIYALLFALFFRMNNAEKTLTHELLARNTPRQAAILLYPYDHKKDSKPLEIAKRAELEFDRTMAPFEAGKAASLVAGGRPCFVLAKAPLPGGVLVAQAEAQPGLLGRLSGRALDFYRQKISQRRKGDSSDWAGWIYLYRDTNVVGQLQHEVQK